MQRIIILISIFLLGCIRSELKADVAAENTLTSAFFYQEIPSIISDSAGINTQALYEILATHPGIYHLLKVKAENKKLVALILTATLGMLGVHRLYLGTKPWIPAVYLFTFGGCFFILPFIDFWVILISKDISRFENNNKVFMWAN